MDNANRAGRMMLSAKVNPAYMARKAGFCPGAIGDTPVFLSNTATLLMDDVGNFRIGEKNGTGVRAEREDGGVCGRCVNALFLMTKNILSAEISKQTNFYT